MAQTTTQRLMELGVPFVMASELMKQVNAGSYNWQRLMNAGWVTELAQYFAKSLAARNYKATKAVEYGCVPAVATLIAGVGYPAPLPKTMVAIGSSNFAGYGSSGYIGGTGSDPVGPSWNSPPTSLVGLTKTGLQAIDPAWTVFNRSISGSSSKTSMDRFFSDVAPHRPSVVWFGNHPRNSNYNWQEERDQHERARSYCALIGAALIVRGFYVDDISNGGVYTAGLAFNKWLDDNGFARVDCLSTLDDGTGNFISPGTYDIGDRLHPNDAGYAIMYSGVDLGLFVAGVGQGPETGFADGGWRVPVATGYDAILVAGVGKPLKSMTVHARIKGVASGGGTGKGFIDITAAAASVLRLINPSAALVWREASTDRVVTAVSPSSDATPHDLALTYNRVTNSVKAYVDGALVGTGTLATPADITSIVFGSRGGASNASFAANGYSFADLAVWNVPLPDAAISRLVSGDYQGGSMIFRGKMGAAPVFPGSIPNAVRNGTSPALNLAWEAVTNF